MASPVGAGLVDTRLAGAGEASMMAGKGVRQG